MHRWSLNASLIADHANESKRGRHHHHRRHCHHIVVVVIIILALAVFIASLIPLPMRNRNCKLEIPNV